MLKDKGGTCSDVAVYREISCALIAELWCAQFKGFKEIICKHFPLVGCFCKQSVIMSTDPSSWNFIFDLFYRTNALLSTTSGKMKQYTTFPSNVLDR